jgi:signal transduction histidine kinase
MDKPDGRIDIRILDEEDSIRVEIEDNGKGIAAQDLPNIFDRFYRTDSSRNSAQGGSGIGLSIVRKVIRSSAAGSCCGNGVRVDIIGSDCEFLPPYKTKNG